MSLKWKGGPLRPSNQPQRQPIKKDYADIMRPLGEKKYTNNLWGSVIMNVEKDGISPTPSVTPSPSITPSVSVTPTPTMTPTPSATPLPPILDTYTANVAYSLNRKLKSTATNAIRIRRSSDNAETDIGFVGTAIDTASITSFVGANDGFITTLYDQSGNNRDATMATLIKQPIVVSGGTILTHSGNIYSQFDGTNDELIGNAATSTSSSMFTYLVSNGPSFNAVSLDEPTLRFGAVDTFDWGYFTSNRSVAIVRTIDSPAQQTLAHSTITDSTFSVNFARQIGGTLSLDINNTTTENLSFAGGTVRRGDLTPSASMIFAEFKFQEFILNQDGSGNPQIYTNQLNFYNY